MFSGLGAMIYKEIIQVRRDPATRVVFVIPIIQLIIFGYALDTDVKHVATVVFDADRRGASRDFISRFESTDVFRVTREVDSAADVRQAIVAGRAKVGILISDRFSDDLALGRPAQVEVLIDGSDNTVASQTMAAANGIALEMAIRQFLADQHKTLPIDLRPKVLFNENMESANFFVPGLVGIILQLTTVLLTAFSIVREREQGTMEQLIVTPVSKWALIFGKVAPFAVIGCLVTVMVLAIMVVVFQVPIEGSKLLLMSLSVVFLIPSLGLGIFISTVARNQAEATQLGMLIMFPSVLLSGFVFPREQMPLPIYLISCLVPVTYYIQILRGIILRGAGAWDLWQPAAVLLIFAVVIFVGSTLRFQKRLE